MDKKDSFLLPFGEEHKRPNTAESDTHSSQGMPSKLPASACPHGLAGPQQDASSTEAEAPELPDSGTPNTQQVTKNGLWSVRRRQLIIFSLLHSISKNKFLTCWAKL